MCPISVTNRSLKFFLSEDDPFEDLTQSEWERLDKAVEKAYDTFLDEGNEGETG